MQKGAGVLGWEVMEDGEQSHKGAVQQFSSRYGCIDLIWIPHLEESWEGRGGRNPSSREDEKIMVEVKHEYDWGWLVRVMETEWANGLRGQSTYKVIEMKSCH